MKDLIEIRGLSVLLVIFIAFTLIPTTTKADVEEPPSGHQTVFKRGQPIILHHDPNPPTTLRVPPPRVFSELSVQSSIIQINYIAAGEKVGDYTCYEWPNEAKSAFNYAAGIWESLVDSTVPIEIDACWTDMSGDILGGSSSTYVYDSSRSTWYHESLANSISGNDQSPNPDMTILYNRNFDWYYGTDGHPPRNELDFASVVLHEICHGLGFAGLMYKSGSRGYWGLGYYNDPATYDRFTENGSGTPLLALGYGTVALGNALTSGDIYFNGPNANAANGGSRPELYAPSSWQPGSSYSHLDFDTFNDTDNELMVYAIADGESIHNPGSITLGMLEDMGWTTSETTPPPTVTSITPNSGVNDGTVHITDLSGSNFVSSTVKLVKSGAADIPGTSVTVVDSSTITCDFDLSGATTGTWDVVVTNDDGQSGVLSDGFTVTAVPAPDVSISKDVIGGDFSPGDPITFTLNIINSGTLTATNVVVTDDLPSEVLSPTYASTIGTPPTGTVYYPHVWNIGTLEPEEGGVITIYGQIDSDLKNGFPFVNTATISDPEDNTPGNNINSVTIGEQTVYLPLVLRS